MPPLVKVYIRQCVFGLALSVVFVAGLIALDVAHLRHLVTSSDVGILAVCLLVLFNGIVFAGVQFAIAIMGMQERPEPPSGGRRQTGANPRLALVPVAAPAEGKPPAP